MTKAEFDLQLILLGWIKLPEESVFPFYTKRDAYSKNGWMLYHNKYRYHGTIKCTLINKNNEEGLRNHFANYHMCMEKMKIL